MLKLSVRPQSFSSAFYRQIHTRAKKVDVQLLKDTYGRRFKGEIFQVSEGHMRLKLHPEGIAAYVLKNQPTPLPVLPADKAQELRKEAQRLAKLAAAQAEEAAQQITEPTAEDVNKQKVQSLIDALDFPTAQQGPTEELPKSVASEPLDDIAIKDAQSKKKFSWQNDFVVNMTEKTKADKK